MFGKFNCIEHFVEFGFIPACEKEALWPSSKCLKRLRRTPFSFSSSLFSFSFSLALSLSSSALRALFFLFWTNRRGSIRFLKRHVRKLLFLKCFVRVYLEYGESYKLPNKSYFGILFRMKWFFLSYIFFLWYQISVSCEMSKVLIKRSKNADSTCGRSNS